MKTLMGDFAVNMSEDFFDRSYNFDESAEKVAQSRNLKVVYPESNQLQIDIDSEEAYDRFRTLKVELGLDDMFEVVVSETISNSGLPHRHITLTLNNYGYNEEGKVDAPVLTEHERIALQFALGSDPCREFLNLKRCLHGVSRPTRLFERKEIIDGQTSDPIPV